jgi:hypothetical protein
MIKPSWNGIAQNEPLSPIREPITFTHLATLKENRWKPGVRQAQPGLILRPEPEKSLTIPARQKTTLRKEGERTQTFQDMRHTFPGDLDLGISAGLAKSTVRLDRGPQSTKKNHPPSSFPCLYSGMRKERVSVRGSGRSPGHSSGHSARARCRSCLKLAQN